jgi:hypothetical protein
MAQLVLTTDTLAGTPVTGTLEYNGQFYGTDSNSSRAQMQRLVLGTALSYTQATNANTTLDFTGIPSWVKRVTVMFNGVSTSGTSFPRIQIGAGSIQSSGYLGTGTQFASASSAAVATGAGGFDIPSGVATAVLSGHMVLTTVGSNIWVVSGFIGKTEAAYAFGFGGNVTLTGALDRVRITTVNGTDTFDAGSVNILYEG